MRYAIAAILLLFSLSVFGQLDQFRMVGSGSWSVVDDSTYSATVTFASDLTANSFLPTGVVDSMRVFTQRGQLYTIDSVGAKTFSTAVIYAVEYGGDWGSPSGQVLVYETRGRETVPAIPFATNGATSKLQEAVVTHNAAINNGVSTTQLADSAAAARNYTNNQVAAVAPVKDTIVQASHGFSLGDPIWYSGDYLLALDTGATVRVDGIVSEVPDVNTFVLQKTGRFTLSSHGFSVGIQLYVQPDGSYSATDTSNTLIYGYALDANTIEIGVKPDAVRATVESRTFEFSRKTLESITRAKNNKKTWVISDTVTISGNLDVSDLDIIFEKNGFISGADTITANGAAIQANSRKQLWSSSTVITGEWNNEVSRVEWTVGANYADTIANFRALTNATLAGNCVELSDSFTVSTGGATSYFVSPKDICWRGTDNAAITFHTEHNSGYGYFMNDVGFNLDIQGIKFYTKDYLGGVYNEDRVTVFNSAYSAGVQPNAKPSSEKITVSDCEFYGNVQLLWLQASSANQSEAEYVNAKLGVSEFTNIKVTRNNRRLVSVTDLGYGYFSINGAQVYEMGRSLFVLSAGGLGGNYPLIRRNNCIYFSAEGNIVKNTIVRDFVTAGVTSEYLTFAIVEGGRIYANNNICDGLLAIVPNVNFETSFIYPSNSESFVFTNNTISDCAVGDDSDANGLLRLKECTNVLAEGNYFSLSLAALDSIGVIDSVTQDLSTITDSDFWFQLFAIGFQNNGGKMIVRNNTFETPFLNQATPIALLNADISDNIFSIGYIASDGVFGIGVDAVDTCTVFFFRDNDDVYTSEGNLPTQIKLSNTYVIDSTDCQRVNLSWTKQDDKWTNNDYLANFEQKNKIITEDNFEIGYGEQKAINSHRSIDAQKIDGFKILRATPTTQKPEFERDAVADITVKELKGSSDSRVFNYRQLGRAEINTKKVLGDTIGLVEYGRQDMLNSSFRTDTITVITTVNFSGIDSTGKRIEKTFKLAAIDLTNPANTYNAYYSLDANNAITRKNYVDALYSPVRMYASIGDQSQRPYADLMSLNSVATQRRSYLRLYDIENLFNVKISITHDTIGFTVGTSLAARLSEVENQLARQNQFNTGKYIVGANNPLGGSDEMGAIVDSVYNSLDLRVTDLETELSYGEAYVDYVDPDTVTVVTAGTLYDLTDVTESTSSSDVTVSTTTGRITYTGTTEKLFSVTWTATVTSNANNENLIGTVMDNGATITRIRWEEEDTASGDTHSVTASGFFSMGQNDWVQPKLTSQSNGTQIEVITMSFRIQEVR